MDTNQLFHEVVDAHGLTVLRVCACTLGPGHDAEDAWAETFAAAVAAHPLPAGTNVEAWLVRVARHKCVDILRSRKREHPFPPDDAEFRGHLEDLAQFTPEQDGELWGAVAQLSERQQFVIAHRFVAEWTYAQIAGALGCTPAAARRTGSDAVARLRTLLSSPATSKQQVSPSSETLSASA